ncbi:hypothetical protein FNV43_RR21296 [Rhamnella rubrinervis]|uniref:Uncharacterized protein n=1 Tax=Rhamnella rubrinervis TaxID=2594499 RepID=A0A8K0GU88_9ROSA|nr:hypothetical protein FNV43_RR21296 [Rhamnella rubrinervis]
MCMEPRTRWSHEHISLSVKDKDFLDWSWLFISLAALTQPDIEELFEAVALLCPITYLEHISTRFVLRIVYMHLDQDRLIALREASSLSEDEIFAQVLLTEKFACFRGMGVGIKSNRYKASEEVASLMAKGTKRV